MSPTINLYLLQEVDIIGFIVDDPNAAEVVKVEDGQLFLVRNETIRSDRECMYVAGDLPG